MFPFVQSTFDVKLVFVSTPGLTSSVELRNWCDGFCEVNFEFVLPSADPIARLQSRGVA